MGFAVMFVGGLATGAYLVVAGHPWFALLVFMITGGLNLSQTNRKEAGEKEHETD